MNSMAAWKALGPALLAICPRCHDWAIDKVEGLLAACFRLKLVVTSVTSVCSRRNSKPTKADEPRRKQLGVAQQRTRIFWVRGTSSSAPAPPRCLLSTSSSLSSLDGRSMSAT